MGLAMIASNHPVIPNALSLLLHFLNPLTFSLPCVQVEGEESEGSESEPESPGIDPLVFSREEFDTGEVRMVSMCSVSAVVHVHVPPGS